MAGFNNFGALVDAQNVTGSQTYVTWRKSPTQTTTRGIWFDLSMSPGNPVPQYYAASPMVATLLRQSTDGGLRHGGNVSSSTKFLRRLMAMTTTATALPMPMILCDYLLYYPFIDEGSTDEQFMDNTTALSRYTDGAGVQMMAVIVGSHSLVSGVQFSVSYTNSSGTAGRTSAVVELTTAQGVNGTIATSARATDKCFGPFIPLQTGDTGVRSIQSVTLLTADVGLFTLVLVKPLAQMTIRGIDAPVEKDFFLDHAIMPIIVDDAYLNFLCCPAGSLAATAIHGDLITSWG